MFKRNVSLTVIGYVFMLMLLSACGAASTGGDESPPSAVLQAQAWLAEQLGVSVGEVDIVSMEQVDWTDSCYGLGGPAESCLAAIIPGWRIDFEVDGQQYEVRCEETGTIARSPQL